MRASLTSIAHHSHGPGLGTESEQMSISLQLDDNIFIAYNCKVTAKIFVAYILDDGKHLLFVQTLFMSQFGSRSMDFEPTLRSC